MSGGKQEDRWAKVAFSNVLLLLREPLLLKRRWLAARFPLLQERYVLLAPLQRSHLRCLFFQRNKDSRAEAIVSKNMSAERGVAEEAFSPQAREPGKDVDAPKVLYILCIHLSYFLVYFCFLRHLSIQVNTAVQQQSLFFVRWTVLTTQTNLKTFLPLKLSSLLHQARELPGAKLSLVCRRGLLPVRPKQDEVPLWPLNKLGSGLPLLLFMQVLEGGPPWWSGSPRKLCGEEHRKSINNLIANWAKWKGLHQTKRRSVGYVFVFNQRSSRAAFINWVVWIISYA